MAKFVIAGKADCPYFAKSELLADDLQLNLPDFTAHKISVHPEKWQEWIEETKKKHGWSESHDNSSPLVWRELIDRGGKGLLIGGSNDFEEYVYQTYGIKLSMPSSQILATATENLKWREIEIEKEEERLASIQPLVCVVTNATSPVALCLYPHLLSGTVFGKGKEVELRILDRPEKEKEGNEIMETIKDMASDNYRTGSFYSNAEKAFAKADVILLLDDITPDDSVEDDLMRKHLHLAKTKAHFQTIGNQIKADAKKRCKVLVCGNVPINFATHVLVQTCSPAVLDYNIAGMAYFKEKLSKALLGSKIGVNPSFIHDVLIWGNVTGKYKVEPKWSKVTQCDGTAITGPCWYSRSTVELVHDNKWLETEFPGMIETRSSELHAALSHGPFMLYASAVLQNVTAWMLGSDSSFTHNLAVVLKYQLYGFPEGMVVSLPVKFHPGCYDIVEDFDVSPNVPDDNPPESEATETTKTAKKYWNDFVASVVADLQSEISLADEMPVKEKVLREKTELDQTAVDDNDLTLADETVLIGVENEGNEADQLATERAATEANFSEDPNTAPPAAQTEGEQSQPPATDEQQEKPPSSR